MRPPSWNLYYDLCQTSTYNVRCHYAQFSENRFSEVLKRGIHTQTHTDTHTDTNENSIRRNALRCISPKNRPKTEIAKNALL